MDGAKAEEPTGLTPPKDTELYETLGVPVTATTAEIKRAYFLAARKWHPDKNKDDPQAEEKFKAISVAYEVLSDPEQRERYHKKGKEGIGEQSGRDPREMFSEMFGGGKFEDIFGEISFVANASGEEKSMEEMQEANKERVVKLAAAMIRRIETYTEGDVEGFKRQAINEAEILKRENYGLEFVRQVGSIYENEAKAFIGGFLGLSGFVAKIKKNGTIVKEVVGAIKQEMLIEQAAMEAEMAEGEDKQKLEEELMNQAMIAMYRLARVDVEINVRKVCETVLSDPDLTKSQKKQRAEALKLMGKIWRKTTMETTATPEHPFGIPDSKSVPSRPTTPPSTID